MTSIAFPAAMLAARLALGHRCPDALDLARQRWAAWLAATGTPAVTTARPRLTICIHVCCREDLAAHPGAMELLEWSGSAAELVLLTPTAAAAAQLQDEALREGWAGLVTILPVGQGLRFVAALPPTRTVAGFVLPSALSAAQQKALPDPIPSEHCYVGPGAGFEAWAAGRLPIASAQLDALLRELVGSGSAHRQAWPKLPAHKDEPADGAASLDAVHRQSGVRLPSLKAGDFLRISVQPPHYGPVTILRRTIVAPDSQLTVQMPPRHIGELPQPLRIDVVGERGAARSDSLALGIPPQRLEPWMLTAFLNRGGAGNPVIRAFAQGTRCRLAYAEDQLEQLADIPVVWGVLRGSDRIIAQARQGGGYWFYIDHAYFNRGHGKAYRITRNGYEAGPIRRCPADRAEALDVQLMPWRKSGRHIIVCPPTDFFMQAHNCADWLEETLQTLRSITDRPIIVREKPVPGQPAVPLPEALQEAHALVTHSSNVAIEAACLGTPVFVSPTSAAAPIGRIDLRLIETPVYPDRQPWLHHLAYNQFSIEEVASGAAWHMLLELEGRPYV